MSVYLPEGIGIDDELGILFERNEERVQIIVSLGDAVITTESTSEAGGEHMALLVQLLPAALATAFDAMEAEQADEEGS